MPKTKLQNSSKPQLYCGSQDELPPAYDDFGSPTDCLRKGFGAGKASCNGTKILTTQELISIAKELDININTGRGKKSNKTLIKNIINVLENIKQTL